MDDLKQLRELIALCRAEGIRRLRWQGIEIELDGPQEPAAPPPIDTKPHEETEDDLRYAASGLVPVDLRELIEQSRGENAGSGRG